MTYPKATGAPLMVMETYCVQCGRAVEYVAEPSNPTQVQEVEAIALRLHRCSGV